MTRLDGRIAIVTGAARRAGILAPVEADVRRYLDMGATFVAVGSDIGLLRNAAQKLRQSYE